MYDGRVANTHARSCFLFSQHLGQFLQLLGINLQQCLPNRALDTTRRPVGGTGRAFLAGHVSLYPTVNATLPAMICANCGEPTEQRPCSGCSAEPILRETYRLESVLGRGATGTTYAGTRIADSVRFALKEIRPTTGAKGAELAVREARALASSRHPQLPAFEEAFLVGAGKRATFWIVQGLIDGQTLHDESGRRPMTETEVLGVINDLLPVLEYLHTQSPPVIHRDIKPKNVMRTRDGRLVLLDLGSVRDAVADPDFGGSTVAGTFGYMAPEQFRGDASPATDIYGLGALCVALLCNREPSSLADHSGRLRWEGEIQPSPRVETLLRGMLALDPKDRFADVAAVRRALVDGPASVLPSGDRDAQAEAQSWRMVAILFALTILLVFLIALFR